jgi:hypothetical protein
MPTQLPSRLYNAHVKRVINPSCVDVAITLNFGIVLNKNIILEGTDTHSLNDAAKKAATHCLVLILGGRDIIVHTDDSLIDGHIKARVYIDQTACALPVGMLQPFGLYDLYPEVGTLYEWAAQNSFDADKVRALMKAVPK